MTVTAPHEPGTLQHLNPNDLVVEKNVRKHVTLDRGFLSSIKQRGVLQPPTAYWDDNAGAWQVLDGQRRVLAARKAEHATIPVVIVDPADADDLRIVDQLAANEHREQLADVDKANAYGELSLFGRSSDWIQKRTNLPEALIQTGIRISQSKTAAAVAEKHPTLMLEQAAVFAEFEDDTEALEQLEETLRDKPEQIVHRASQIRQERQDQAARDTAIAALSAEGIDVVENRLDGAWPLTQTFATAQRTGGAVTLEQAQQTGAAVAAILYRSWRDDDERWVPEYYVLDGKTHGLHTYDWNDKPAKNEPTEKDRAARKAARENTKAWKAATEVRRDFVRGLYQRKELPLGWTGFTLDQQLNLIKQQQQSTWKSIGAILGIDGLTSAWDALPKLKTYIADRPQNVSQIMFAIALGTFEGQQDFDTKGWSFTEEAGTEVVTYLKLLATWGYTLSEVEQYVIDGTVPA